MVSVGVNETRTLGYEVRRHNFYSTKNTPGHPDGKWAGRVPITDSQIFWENRCFGSLLGLIGVVLEVFMKVGHEYSFTLTEYPGVFHEGCSQGLT